MESAIPAARSCSPYEAVLGEAFASLHAHVRRAHLPPLCAEGTIDVEHGPGWLAHPIIWLMKLPAAGPRQPVRLDVAEDGSAFLVMELLDGAPVDEIWMEHSKSIPTPIALSIGNCALGM